MLLKKGKGSAAKAKPSRSAKRHASRGKALKSAKSTARSAKPAKGRNGAAPAVKALKVRNGQASRISVLKTGNGHAGRASASKSGNGRTGRAILLKSGNGHSSRSKALTSGNGHVSRAKGLTNGHKPRAVAALKAAGDVIKAREPVARRGSYLPRETEPFMNSRQREYFRKKLVTWKDELLAESRETLETLQAESHNHPDYADRASSETDRSIELRARDRQRKLISKIQAALKRIDEGTYGYCEETGEPINLKRLVARPIATLSVEAQERHERRERVYRDE